MRGESGDDDRVTQRSRDREIEQAAGRERVRRGLRWEMDLVVCVVMNEDGRKKGRRRVGRSVEHAKAWRQRWRCVGRVVGSG